MSPYDDNWLGEVVPAPTRKTKVIICHTYEEFVRVFGGRTQKMDAVEEVQRGEPES